jgi:hypothetical protein
MQHNAGFENRFIDTYHLVQDSTNHATTRNLWYAPIFNPNNSLTTIAFPGIKQTSVSTIPSQNADIPSGGAAVPYLILFVLLLFTVVKYALRCSVSNIFLIGISPKGLQENDRRQLEHNTWFVNGLNAVAFFTIALITYIYIIRFSPLAFQSELVTLSTSVQKIMFFLKICGGIFGFFYIKNLIVVFYGSVFSVQPIMADYLKKYKMFFTSSSPLLLCFAILMAFLPMALIGYNAVAFFLLGLVAFYFLFCFKLLIKFYKNFGFQYIHIFLYLCTLEIVPIFIIGKVYANSLFLTS